MLTFSADAFYHVTGELRILRGMLSNEHIVREVEEAKPEAKPYDRDLLLCQEALPLLNLLRTHLAELGARVTMLAVDELAYFLDGSRRTSYPYERIMTGLDDIDTQLRRELSVVKIFVLSPQEQDKFAPPAPLFGNEVAIKFLSITYDVDEAGKCLALGRSTAAAFHALRSLEAGIRAMSRCLQIPDPIKGVDRSWGNMLRAINIRIDAIWPKNTLLRQSEDCRLFEDAFAALSGMMNPWRNESMHLSDKFTEEEARHIFEVVGGFMRKVAFRMNEDGEPKA